MFDESRHCAWIDSVERNVESVAETIDKGVATIGRLPSRGERWVVKLNLTYPTYLPGVVNSTIFVEGLCKWACDRNIDLVLIEGDGGNGSYSAQDTFDGNGITEIARRYHVDCVSISEKPWELKETRVLDKTVRLPYSPFFKRREFDRFVIAPLFKNHIFTTATLGMKNLWGCIPDAYRMYYHYFLDHGIVALCKELRPDFSIFDGIIALRGRGPMEGKPLDMNAVMVSSDVGAGELAALQIMGLPISKVRHLQIAVQDNVIKNSEVSWLVNPESFFRDDFILERTMLNRLSIQISKLPKLQRLIYHSAISSMIYRVVHVLRGESAQTKLLKAKWDGKYHEIPRND